MDKQKIFQMNWMHPKEIFTAILAKKCLNLPNEWLIYELQERKERLSKNQERSHFVRQRAGTETGIQESDRKIGHILVNAKLHSRSPRKVFLKKIYIGKRMQFAKLCTISKTTK